MLDLITYLDGKLFLLINSHYNIFFDYFFYSITQLGNGWILFPILLGIVTIKTPRFALKRVLLFSVISLSAAGIVNTQLKHHINRPRPILYFEHNPIIYPKLEKKSTTTTRLETLNHFKVHVVGPVLLRHSFPSGHTETVFSAAALLTWLYGGWFGLAYILAFLVGYSRIYIGAHFPLDTVTGAMIGILIVISIMPISGLKKRTEMNV